MLTKEEKKKLEPFFTNLDKNVSVLLNMPEVLKGALFSRYSRSTKPLRQLFLEEYLKNDESGYDASVTQTSSSNLVTEKAEKFYSKWLAEYGDDSIAELGGIHLGIEEVSVLATKAMEDRRLGLSPLEKSTRYVRFDDKVKGRFKYYIDPEIQKSRYSKLYSNTMDLLFDTYSELILPMMVYFRSKYPKPEIVSDKAYETSIRAKACDILRDLLPLSTLTNMGIFGNGRAYEYMITRMMASNLHEVRMLADSSYRELDKVIHNFVERVKTSKGEAYINYLKNTDSAVRSVSTKFVGRKVKEEKVNVQLVDFDKDAEAKVVASILYINSNLPLTKLIALANKMSQGKREKILKSYYDIRQGRWHKIGRAFEDSYYHFDIISDFGAYKDLQRHRVLTQDKQLFTCDLGFDVPADVKEAGFDRRYTRAMALARKSFDKMRSKFPVQAQYLVTHGYKVRYRMKMNLREAFHLCELRSSPQGHPNYRYIAQEIYKRIKEVHPGLAEGMRYVDMGNPGLERLASEVRREEKMRKADLALKSV